MATNRQPLGQDIHELAWGDDGLDAAVAGIVLAREASTPGLQVSNVGGWHSTPDLHRWGEQPITQLVARIRGVAPCVGAEDLRLQAWANVMRAGAHHKAHRHGEATWSGVYYVDAGDGGSGRITFARRAESRTIQPRRGLMLVFPGELLHSVEDYFGERPRISVAFNLFPGPETARLGVTRSV